MKRQILVFSIAMCAVLAGVHTIRAEDNAVKVQPANVEMFGAMKSGDLEVKFIPKNATQANVIFTNKTDKPLNVKLPEAFAAVHAQMGGMGGGGMGGGGMGGGGMGGGGQGMGGGMGGMGGGGMGGGGMGGGMMAIAPGKVIKSKVTTVCMEHGKKDPNARMTYKIVPIESFTKDPAQIELARQLGYGKIDQVSAQAAMWHLADGLTWQQLASKVKVKHLNGSVEMFFNRVHLTRAYHAVEFVKKASKSHKATEKSPGDVALAN